MFARNVTRGTVAGISTTRVLAMVAAAGATGAVLAGCTPNEEPSSAPGTTPPVITGDQVNPDAEAHPGASSAGGEQTGASGSESGANQTATVTLRDKSGGDVGMATFTSTGSAVTVELRVTGIEPGLHGVHVHSVGKCDAADNFSSAGGHLQVNGHTGKPESGDLTSVSVLKDGTGTVTSTTDAFTIDQAKDKALVVHEVGDTDGTKRQACGVIEAK
ncbi:superoxide dismutase family protein [Gordonia zhaorongruii]|uniref:superoxide dismutase family protein n=1 Tax=Gordonia zhaorongruii TaxID=2597659 RepID=UPI00104FA4E4|nr:superoxide dismutase family protein [Gordonia zhaorongruii]